MNLKAIPDSSFTLILGFDRGLDSVRGPIDRNSSDSRIHELQLALYPHHAYSGSSVIPLVNAFHVGPVARNLHQAPSGYLAREKVRT